MWFNQKSSYFLDTFGKQSRSEVTNMRPAGRMRPAKEFPVAREHFGETSTFKHFFPV